MLQEFILNHFNHRPKIILKKYLRTCRNYIYKQNFQKILFVVLVPNNTTALYKIYCSAICEIILKKL